MSRSKSTLCDVRRFLTHEEVPFRTIHPFEHQSPRDISVGRLIEALRQAELNHEPFMGRATAHDLRVVLCELIYLEMSVDETAESVLAAVRQVLQEKKKK